MREWKLRLENEGISEERYNELKWFARQYDQLREKERRFRSGEEDRRAGSNEGGRPHSDPTATGGIRLASSPYAWKIAAIEQAAAVADPEMCRWVLENVARAVAYEKIDPPCNRERFFRARRRFFVELNRMLE